MDCIFALALCFLHACGSVEMVPQTAAPPEPGGVPPVEAQISGAQSEHPADREAAISWLLSHPDEAEPALRARALSGREAQPRVVLAVLGAIGDPASVPALATVLDRGRPEECLAAAQALVAHRAPVAREAVLAGFTSPSPEVRSAVAGAVAAPAQADWACGPLRGGLEDPVQRVSWHMARGAWLAGCVDAAEVREAAARQADPLDREGLLALIGE